MVMEMVMEMVMVMEGAPPPERRRKRKKSPFLGGRGRGKYFRNPIDSKNLFCYTEINLIRIILI